MSTSKPSNLLLKILEKPELSVMSDLFRHRLSFHFHKLYGLFERLYGSDQLESLMTKLVVMLANSFSERSEELKDIDCSREQNRKWFLSNELVGMMLYTSRFSGDIKSLQKRLSYFEDLGINLLHLMPILYCPPAHNDGGYAVSDYKRVDPDLGDMEDVRRLTKHLRKREMLLMLDLVVNHTSNEHEWAMRAKAGEKEYEDYYYFYPDRDVPDQMDATMPEIFPETSSGSFTHVPELDKWVMTVFHDYQWDLNYTNPAVFISMTENMLFLANQGVDIVRLDALAFMWKQMGTTSQNLEEAHLLVQAMKSCVDIVAPGLLLLAEAIVAPNEIVKYFGEGNAAGNECDLAYNATLMTLLWDAVATKNNRLLNATLDNIPSRPAGVSWLNYVRCHDDIGLGYDDQHAAWAGYDAHMHRKFLIDFYTQKIDWSFARGKPFMERDDGDVRISGSLASLAGLEAALEKGDKPLIALATDRILMLHAIILSYGGIPMLYMGDELGFTNDYLYHEIPDQQHDNRWMHRPKMNWDREKRKTDLDTIEGSIYQGLVELIALRKNLTAFSDHHISERIWCHSQHLLAYTRHDEESKVFCLFNLNDQIETLQASVVQAELAGNDQTLVDLISGKTLKGEHILLSPYAVMWIVAK
ncbi:MAG: hypothetical protein JXQ90_17350 [Cyclobacteriaceae bacterium]